MGMVPNVDGLLLKHMLSTHTSCVLCGNAINLLLFKWSNTVILAKAQDESSKPVLLKCLY